MEIFMVIITQMKKKKGSNNLVSNIYDSFIDKNSFRIRNVFLYFYNHIITKKVIDIMLPILKGYKNFHKANEKLFKPD